MATYVVMEVENDGEEIDVNSTRGVTGTYYVTIRASDMDEAVAKLVTYLREDLMFEESVLQSLVYQPDEHYLGWRFYFVPEKVI